MGIRGLKSFIENNSDLLSRHHLHDTCLVIDGNNLMNSLYFQSSRISKDHIYGGDYSRFAASLYQFFKSLDKCLIRAVVVFDGGIDPSQQKMKTIVDRFRKKLKATKEIARGGLCDDRILPSLCKELFLELLSDLNICHLQASYEADACIARIANCLNCPVLSNDSDFFVFDLKFGVVSIDSLIHPLFVKTYCDSDDKSYTYKYLDCNLFLIENLIEYFPGLKRDILPLFSTLMGNDWVEPYVFDNVFNAIPEVTAKSRRNKRSLHVGKRHHRMVKLLNWLRERTVKESIDFLIKFLKENSRSNALSLLELSLENYSNESPITLNCGQEVDLSQLHLLLPNADQSLPQWFVDEFHRSQLMASFMNAIKLKCVFLNPRVEDFSLPSSYSCAFELRQYLIALLRLDDKDINAITMYTRVGNQMSCFQLGPQLLTPNNLLVLPNLHQLRNISIDERRVLLSDILSINEELYKKFKHQFVCDDCIFDYKYSDINGAVFLMIAMKYWISKCCHQIWSEFIHALLTSIIFCGYFDSYTKTKFILFDKKQINESIKQLSKYNSRPIHNSAKLFQPRIVHFYNELQDCIRVIRWLNTLLGQPYEMGAPFFALNGPFIYNLTVELSSRKDPVLYLSQLFGRQSLATNIFERLLSLIQEDVDSKKFVRCLEVTTRKTHIQGMRGSKKSKSLAKNFENRFSALTVNDN